MDITGKYVEFNNEVFLATETLSGMVRIINPCRKTRCAIKNVKVLNITPAKRVTYRNANYLVSGKGLIISLTTHKIMNWSKEDGNRIAILDLAH